MNQELPWKIHQFEPTVEIGLTAHNDFLFVSHLVIILLANLLR